MKTPLKAITDVVETLLRSGAKSSVKYLSPTQIVRATAIRPMNKRRVEVVLTIGSPNFAERVLIKKFKKIGVKFPVPAPKLKFISKKK